MIKGKVKDAIWILEGALAIVIAILFFAKLPTLTVFFSILLLANFMLIGAGSRVDKMFLIYPYGTFLVIFWGGFLGLFYYWKLYYNAIPKTLFLGMHPGTAILWVVFLVLGGFLTTILSYTVLFEKNVISQKEWDTFISDVEDFNKKHEQEEKPEEEIK
ncbi:MAG: hypothetical protein ACP5PO_07315 [Desulfurella sp.]|uniref:Uncharacterized protein n=1 Tax=Desulfurella multipotens TaxID=79269 RepID=A0A1G6LB43_9BACT|nr:MULTISPECIES: hypothetical protein [Desulfurella]AHF97875.1 hypothetical protein DESACE_04010 [Desulfurella acetivorans A63]PMP92505.1 MAG: hypothetical protein C0173_02130 [Desulfurella sp.]SDC40672.1 hypothetical protein SAMN05660835_00772 [Desulfurella multipotens]